MIRGYNHLAQVLVEYELIQLRQWKQKLIRAKQSMLSSILVRHGLNLLVNFDPNIIEFLWEVQVLHGMSIEIPSEAVVLYSKKANILDNYDKMNVSIVFIYVTMNYYITVL